MGVSNYRVAAACITFIQDEQKSCSSSETDTSCLSKKYNNGEHCGEMDTGEF